MFSLLARSRYQSAELIAYEPNPRNAEIIRLLIAKNRLALSFNECAVSTESAELSFVAINSHGGRLAGKESAHLKMGDSPVYKVQVVDFPAALRAMYIESLLLKMDIEGEERNVLPAIMPLLPRRTALFFETHHGKVGWSEIEGLLTRNGFTVEQINARGLYCDGFASRLS
jgi:FkbM family methyltransferase